MKANICGRRFLDVYKGWYSAYSNVIQALHELNIDIAISPFLDMQHIPEYATVGIEDSPKDIYVYNHTHLQDLRKNDFKLGVKTLFIKPTLPTPNHFTLDSVGYAAGSSITYKRPNYLGYDSYNFISNEVPKIIQERPNKWSDRDWCQFGGAESLNLPDNHILIIGQVPNDETCKRMSFGDHIKKLEMLVDSIDHLPNIVVKLHPHLLDEDLDENGPYRPDPRYYDMIESWESRDITVLTGYSSLFDILPQTKVAIVDNSTSGLECLMHQVPVISYGYPEYHWVTKDLRHAHILPDFINDMSWYNREEANSFIAWYFEQYLCCDLVSTRKRILEIFSE